MSSEFIACRHGDVPDLNEPEPSIGRAIRSGALLVSIRCAGHGLAHQGKTLHCYAARFDTLNTSCPRRNGRRIACPRS